MDTPSYLELKHQCQTFFLLLFSREPISFDVTVNQALGEKAFKINIFLLIRAVSR